MTLAELLALLGRYWSRLLIYPGGVGVLIACLLVYRQSATPRQDRCRRDGCQTLRRGFSTAVFISGRLTATELTVLAAPWLGLALLPLPLAGSVGRSVDLVFALVLLEWPRLLVAIHEAESGQIPRLAALLNSYPPYIGALLLLAVPGGSLDVATIGQAPGETASQLVIAAHWFGAVAGVMALPALLGLEPFHSSPPESLLLRLGLEVRAVGIVALVALPWAGLIPEALRWLLPLPVVAVVGVAWGLQRIGRQRATLPWAQALLWLCAAEVVVLLLAGAEGFALRLR
jgi:hypothetical protein